MAVGRMKYRSPVLLTATWPRLPPYAVLASGRAVCVQIPGAKEGIISEQNARGG